MTPEEHRERVSNALHLMADAIAVGDGELDPSALDGRFDLAALQELHDVEPLLIVYTSLDLPDAHTAARLWDAGLPPIYISAYRHHGVTDFDEMISIAGLLEHPELFLLWAAAGFVTADDIEEAMLRGLDGFAVYKYAERNITGPERILDLHEQGFDPETVPIADCDCDDCDELRRQRATDLLRRFQPPKPN